MYSLKKASKLKNSKDFQAVYKEGKSIANRLMVLYMLPNRCDCKQIGFAAGKRLGNAVVRNRVKRMLREAYRLNQHLFPAGYNYILVGRQPAVTVKTQAISTALVNLLTKVRVSQERQ